MTWTCSECQKTTEYESKFDSDFPEGWFGVENNAWYSPCCSAKCVIAYIAIYAEVDERLAPAVSPGTT